MNYIKLLLNHSQMNEKYQQLHREKFAYPYFYKILKNNQTVYFVGPHHTFDPDDQQINSIKKYWNDFIDKTKNTKCITLTEGGKRKIKPEKQAILSDGEAGLITYLSNKEGVKNASPEPSEKQIASELSKKYSREEIVYHDFANYTAQWNRSKDKPKYSDYMKNLSILVNKKYGWKEFDCSLKNMKKLHKEFTGKSFIENDYNIFNQMTNPIENKLSSESSVIRDIYILKEILKYWEENISIFIVYGSGHAIVLEPALKKLLR